MANKLNKVFKKNGKNNNNNGGVLLEGGKGAADRKSAGGMWDELPPILQKVCHSNPALKMEMRQLRERAFDAGLKGGEYQLQFSIQLAPKQASLCREGLSGRHKKGGRKAQGRCNGPAQTQESAGRRATIACGSLSRSWL